MIGNLRQRGRVYGRSCCIIEQGGSDSVISISSCKKPAIPPAVHRNNSRDQMADIKSRGCNYHLSCPALWWRWESYTAVPIHKYNYTVSKQRNLQVTTQLANDIKDFIWYGEVFPTEKKSADWISVASGSGLMWGGATPGPGPSFSKHLKSVTMVTCLSPKFIHPN